MYENQTKALRWLANMFPYTHPAKSETDKMSNCIHLYCEQGANAIQELEITIAGLHEVIKGFADDMPRWIPVTERLPEIDEKHHCSKDVLAYLKDGGMCFTALEENIFGQACFECERNPAVEEEMIVTHWMPLPEPPKEET